MYDWERSEDEWQSGEEIENARRAQNKMKLRESKARLAKIENAVDLSFIFSIAAVIPGLLIFGDGFAWSVWIPRFIALFLLELIFCSLAFSAAAAGGNALDRRIVENTHPGDSVPNPKWFIAGCLVGTAVVVILIKSGW